MVWFNKFQPKTKHVKSNQKLEPIQQKVTLFRAFQRLTNI